MLKLPFLLVLITFIFPAISYAQSCRSGATANQNAVSTVLSRQLSALRAMERSRGCRSGDAQGGFFNACRDLSNRIGEIQRQFGASGGCQTGRASTSARSIRKTERAIPASLSGREGGSQNGAVAQSKATRGPKNALTFCVRLSDGYYFPTPHSQFKQKGGNEVALAQCRLICETENMAVYVLNDQNDETADMISVDNGRSYADLPTAYNYHGDGDFRRCNWAGYLAKVTTIASEKKQAKLLAKSDIPLPEGRPELDPSTTAQLPLNAFQSMPDRKVRVIGPAFMPDMKNDAFTLIDSE